MKTDDSIRHLFNLDNCRQTLKPSYYKHNKRFSSTCFFPQAWTRKVYKNTDKEFHTWLHRLTDWRKILREHNKRHTCDLENFCSNYDFIFIGREKNSAPGVCNLEPSGAALQPVVPCNSRRFRT
jgi:hypothetical protein